MIDLDQNIRDEITLHVILTIASLNILRSEDYYSSGYEEPLHFSDEDFELIFTLYVNAGRRSVLTILNEEPLYIAGQAVGKNIREIDNLDRKTWDRYRAAYRNISRTYDSTHLYDQIKDIVQNYIFSGSLLKREPGEVVSSRTNWRLEEDRPIYSKKSVLSW